MIVAAIDNSQTAGLVTDAAARLAAVHDRVVHVVHAQEGATAGDASRELWRHARSNVLVVNPDAPAGVPAEDLWREPAKD